MPAMDEPRFAPALSGELSLVRTEGDARLSADGYLLAAWSPDAKLVAITDQSAVTIRRAEDGKLVDLGRCADRELSANQIVFSPDGGEVIVSGLLRARRRAPRDRLDPPPTLRAGRRPALTRARFGDPSGIRKCTQQHETSRGMHQRQAERGVRRVHVRSRGSKV